MINLCSVIADPVAKTAIVQVGATLGEVYYWIYRASGTLTFLAGFGPQLVPLDLYVVAAVVPIGIGSLNSLGLLKVGLSRYSSGLPYPS